MGQPRARALHPAAEERAPRRQWSPGDHGPSRPSPRASLHVSAAEDVRSLLISLRARGRADARASRPRPLARPLDDGCEHPPGRLSTLRRDRRDGAARTAAENGVRDRPRPWSSERTRHRRQAHIPPLAVSGISRVRRDVDAALDPLQRRRTRLQDGMAQPLPQTRHVGFSPSDVPHPQPRRGRTMAGPPIVEDAFPGPPNGRLGTRLAPVRFSAPVAPRSAGGSRPSRGGRSGPRVLGTKRVRRERDR